ncbi:hypothetical protein Bca4012_041022 [Brassica carinata]
MQEYWLESSGHNKTVDYAFCKIYLSPTAKQNMKEEDVEELEEETVQPRTPQPQFWPTELDSCQPLQPQPLNTTIY